VEAVFEAAFEDGDVGFAGYDFVVYLVVVVAAGEFFEFAGGGFPVADLGFFVYFGED